MVCLICSAFPRLWLTQVELFSVALSLEHNKKHQWHGDLTGKAYSILMWKRFGPYPPPHHRRLFLSLRVLMLKSEDVQITSPRNQPIHLSSFFNVSSTPGCDQSQIALDTVSTWSVNTNLRRSYFMHATERSLTALLKLGILSPSISFPFRSYIRFWNTGGQWCL